MKTILSVILLLLLSGCGLNVSKKAEEVQLKLSSSIELFEFERIDDIEKVVDRDRGSRKLVQIKGVLRPELRDITICHRNRKTKQVDYSEWLEHREHGDTIGACLP